MFNFGKNVMDRFKSETQDKSVAAPEPETRLADILGAQENDTNITAGVDAILDEEASIPETQEEINQNDIQLGGIMPEEPAEDVVPSAPQPDAVMTEESVDIPVLPETEETVADAEFLTQPAEEDVSLDDILGGGNDFSVAEILQDTPQDTAVADEDNIALPSFLTEPQSQTEADAELPYEPEPVTAPEPLPITEEVIPEAPQPEEIASAEIVEEEVQAVSEELPAEDPEPVVNTVSEPVSAPAQVAMSSADLLSTMTSQTSVEEPETTTDITVPEETEEVVADLPPQEEIISAEPVEAIDTVAETVEVESESQVVPAENKEFDISRYQSPFAEDEPEDVPVVPRREPKYELINNDEEQDTAEMQPFMDEQVAIDTKSVFWKADANGKLSDNPKEVNRHSGCENWCGDKYQKDIQITMEDSREAEEWKIVVMHRFSVPLSTGVSELTVDKAPDAVRYASLVYKGEEKLQIFNQSQYKFIAPQGDFFTVQGNVVCARVNDAFSLEIQDYLQIPVKDYLNQILRFDKPASGFICGPNVHIFFANAQAIGLKVQDVLPEADIFEYEPPLKNFDSKTCFVYAKDSEAGEFTAKGNQTCLVVDTGATLFGWNVRFDDGTFLSLRDVLAYQSKHQKLPSAAGDLLYENKVLKFSGVERMQARQKTLYYSYGKM